MNRSCFCCTDPQALLGLYTQTHCRKDFRKPQARYIYPPGAINRTILYERTGGGLLRGQAMPVAQIPLRPLQIHLRIHGTGAGIQVHYPQKHFTTQEYTKERTGNLRFLQLPERILFRHFLQETDWNVATAIPQNVGKHHIAITLSVE